MREIMNKSIDDICKDRKILKRLEDLGIHTVAELCNLSRIELSKKGLENIYINDIIVALQLNGLDLKPNHAKKNHFIME